MVHDHIEEEVVNVDLHEFERDDVISEYAKETAMKYFLNHFEKSRWVNNAPKSDNKNTAI
jgi:hypothetical protein